jgi:hypothetical protein
VPLTKSRHKKAGRVSSDLLWGYESSPNRQAIQTIKGKSKNYRLFLGFRLAHRLAPAEVEGTSFSTLHFLQR